MQVVIPMSGRSSRFLSAGYSTIKPLIEVDGRPLIHHVIEMFSPASDFIFVCASDHLKEFPLRETLLAVAPNAKIVAIEPQKKGPVWAVLKAAQHISDALPTVVNYCDFNVYWNPREFEKTVLAKKYDGAITAYRGFHPHSLGPNLYAYMKCEGDRVLEIREKGCFTDNRMDEFASAGTYYFKTGALMKKYFQKAVDEKLALNGEFYASLPYNPMIKDGLSIGVYELEHFLQWGTPEDLREYQSWSNWFQKWADWKANLSLPGTCLIPMAGDGVRFRKQGYTTPKPLIPVDGIPMLERSLSTIPKMARTILVCRKDLETFSAFASLVNSRSAQTVGLSQPTNGQAETCLKAVNNVPMNEPLFVSACDASFSFDEKAFAKLVSDRSIDFVVWTFRNHPHANRNPNQYGWVESSLDGAVKSVSCKKALSDNPNQDPGIVGTFWFRNAGVFFDEVRRMIAADDRINGEFYVDQLVSRLAKQGLNGRLFDVGHFICFGTPHDARTYEYWAKYFKLRAAESQSKRTAQKGGGKR